MCALWPCSKTRSMRENPTPHSDPAEQFFIGDNAKVGRRTRSRSRQP